MECHAKTRSLAVAAAEIDAVICATCTPEFLLPQTSTLVQTGLGIPDCRCLDLRAGCAGVVQALDLGAMLIANGRARHVLVTGSDCFSPQNWPRVQDAAARSMDDVMDAAMLSDMAAAAVLSPCEEGAHGQLLFAASGSPRPDLDPGLVTEPLVPHRMLPFEWAPKRKMAQPPRVSQRHNLIGSYLRGDPGGGGRGRADVERLRRGDRPPGQPRADARRQRASQPAGGG